MMENAVVENSTRGLPKIAFSEQLLLDFSCEVQAWFYTLAVKCPQLKHLLPWVAISSSSKCKLI